MVAPTSLTDCYAMYNKHCAFFLIKQLRNCLPYKNVLVVLINNTIYFLFVPEISNQASCRSFYVARDT